MRKITRLIVLDFETYYDDDYTLGKGKISKKKSTMESYINSDKFEVIACSFKVGNQPTYNVINHDNAVGIELAKLKLDEEGTMVVSHTKYDHAILSWHYNIYPWFTGDTDAMARVAGWHLLARGTSLAKLTEELINAGYKLPRKGSTVVDMKGLHLRDMTEQQQQEYGEYCINDTEITSQIFDMLEGIFLDGGYSKNIYNDEMEAINLTNTMFTNRYLKLNRPILVEYLEKLKTERANMLENMAVKYGFVYNEEDVATFKRKRGCKDKEPPFTLGATNVDAMLTALRSDTQFIDLLARFGETPGLKPSMGKSARSKDEQGNAKMIPALAKNDPYLQKLLESENPDLRELAESRLQGRSSIAITRAELFVDTAQRGWLPVPLQHASAHTGRYGGQDYNLQNLPSRVGDLTLRKSIIAPDNYVIVDVDSSQVEARTIAYICQQKDVLEQYIAGEDVYSHMAAKIFGINYEQAYREGKLNPTKEGKLRRNIGKEAVLACGFGLSGATLLKRLEQYKIVLPAGLTADLIVKTYREYNQSITGMWSYINKVIIPKMYNGDKGYFGGIDGKLFFADGSDKVLGETIPSIMLPNGFKIRYKNLRQVDGLYGPAWCYDFLNPQRSQFELNFTHGAKILQNCTQALAFAIMRNQAINMSKRGVPIALNIHDEWAAVVPMRKAGAACEVMVKAMRTEPDWVKGLPLDCEVDIGTSLAKLNNIPIKARNNK